MLDDASSCHSRYFSWRSDFTQFTGFTARLVTLHSTCCAGLVATEQITLNKDTAVFPGWLLMGTLPG
jgi:hypothetical protein